MKRYTRAVSDKLGIDSAIAFTVLARMIQAGGGVISILFIAKYLTVVEQGYYFTFGSILAIQVFFELGLSSIITQFVAHEVAHLEWFGKTELTGSEESRSRLASLLRFCVKWFFVIALILIVILLISGYVFFNKYGKGDNSVSWQSPWIILSITTACSLMLSPILAFFEGLGKVKEVAKIRLVQQISQLVFLVLLLVLGFRLYASPLAASVTFCIGPIWIFVSYKKDLLKFIWNQLGEARVDYKLEIFPYQWRIALSWISGYFIFQLFNPVLFATEGPVVAGQMGMTLAALNGVLAISLSWVNTKIPLFSSLIAKKEYKNLDLIFDKTVIQGCYICGGCLFILITAVFTLKHFNISIGNRFLPMFPLILMCLTTFVNQLISALATYLRCHKQEPFLIQSIVFGILTATSTFTLGKMYGVNGIVVGYSVLVVSVGLIWSIILFRKMKLLWH